MVIWEGEIHLKMCLLNLKNLTNRVLTNKILQNNTEVTGCKSSGPRYFYSLLCNEERS